MARQPIRFPNGVTIYPPKPGATRQQHRVRYRDRTGARRDLWRKTRSDAEEAAHEIARQLGEPANSQPTPDPTRLYSDLLDAYLNPDTHRRDWSLNHARKEASIVNNWIRPQLGGRPVGTITDVDMRQIIRNARDNGLSDNYVRGVGGTLRAIATLGARYGWLPHNLMDDVTYTARSRTQGQARTYIEPDQIPDTRLVDLMAAQAADITGLWWRALEVDIAAYAGLRWGELHALTTDDINLNEGIIRVDRQVTYIGGRRHIHLPKYEKVRRTVIVDRLEEPLAKRLAELDGQPPPDEPACCRDTSGHGAGPLLFPAIKGGYQSSSHFHNPDKWFRRACAAAGWPQDAAGGWRWSWHDLRHHFCTWCLATPPDGLGLEVADVALFAGHATPAFTFQVYVDVRQGAFNRAREAARRNGR